VIEAQIATGAMGNVRARIFWGRGVKNVAEVIKHSEKVLTLAGDVMLAMEGGM
jgi:hypothetical protein